MSDRPSDRVIEQRLRNRVMEALEALADGADGVRREGVVEYVEEFFDVINDDSRWRHSKCFTGDEVRGLGDVHDLLDAACLATPNLDQAGFIDSGWPERIRPVAARLLEVMRTRGRFREDAEEAQPSLPT